MLQREKGTQAFCFSTRMGLLYQLDLAQEEGKKKQTYKK